MPGAALNVVPCVFPGIQTAVQHPDIGFSVKVKKPPETSSVVSFVIDYDCGIVIDAQPAGKFLEAFTVHCHAGLAGVGLARGMEGAGNMLNQPGNLLYRSQYYRFPALSVQHRFNLGRGNQGMPAREALVLPGLQRAAQEQENERQ